MMEEYICSLCPRNCNAKRTSESGKGFCKMGNMLRIARSAPHFWEEPCISGTKGSGTIFFSGCVLSCVFCQNQKISTYGYGKNITVHEFIEYVKALEEQGVHNINLVSPTPYVESIIEAFSVYRPKVPIVYNTGGYEKVETLKRLEGIVSVYLPDLKYIRSEVSARYSKAADYFDYAAPAIREMVRQTGKPEFEENGIMKKGTIVRHLILPQNTKNSIEVLRYLDKEYSDDILVSLMGQYTPVGMAEKYPEINRCITPREYEKVLSVLEELSLDGFVQELDSANSRYIPDFDISKL